ncbi:MAG: VOC family protein [Chloroflexi bacterium]|nr:VOC family protein [Chloroflexota bacterium]
MPKITTFLTFDDQAEQAVNFYTSIFKNSKILSMNRYGEGGPMPAGTVMGASFVLDGQEFYALNGGPHFNFSEGMSLYVDCKTQKEVDYFWDKLSAGGEQQPCGWLKDKFGVSWQIIPTALSQLMVDPNPKKANNVVQAMLKMSKIDIAELKRAHEQA